MNLKKGIILKLIALEKLMDFVNIYVTLQKDILRLLFDKPMNNANYLNL